MSELQRDLAELPGQTAPLAYGPPSEDSELEPTTDSVLTHGSALRRR
ncbi:hypothetical protein NKH18_25095 [Streptomyces sp. M10(2022)]